MVPGPIKILGVTFPPLVFKIWDLNSQEIVLKIKKLLNHWSKRKLIISGRITIIKSIAVSKFVHIFYSLPAPPNGLISELEKTILSVFVEFRSLQNKKKNYTCSKEYCLCRSQDDRA